MHLYKDKKEYHASIHRLVAEAYIPNPNNLPVVDHIDDNPFNNHVSNLQWVTIQQNVQKSYKNTSCMRNFIECKLYKNGEFIMRFHCIKQAAEYVNALTGCSVDRLRRRKKYKDYVIKV